MSNVQKVLAGEIRRLARKEIKAAVLPLVKQNKLLKQELARQAKLVKELSKSAAAAPKTAAPTAAPASADAKPARKAPKRAFRPAALVAFRKKFSLSQRAVATLLSTSLVSVTNWENGHAVPRDRMLEKINALRRIGKRELAKLLPEDARKPRRKARIDKKNAASAPAPASSEAAPTPQA